MNENENPYNEAVAQPLYMNESRNLCKRRVWNQYNNLVAIGEIEIDKSEAKKGSISATLLIWWGRS